MTPELTIVIDKKEEKVAAALADNIDKNVKDITPQSLPSPCLIAREQRDSKLRLKTPLLEIGELALPESIISEIAEPESIAPEIAEPES